MTNVGESTPDTFYVAGNIRHNGQVMADKKLFMKIDGGMDENESRSWLRNVATTSTRKQRFDCSLLADVGDFIDEEIAANNYAKFTFFMTAIG